MYKYLLCVTELGYCTLLGSVDEQHEAAIDSDIVWLLHYKTVVCSLQTGGWGLFTRPVLAAAVGMLPFCRPYLTDEKSLDHSQTLCHYK